MNKSIIALAVAGALAASAAAQAETTLYGSARIGVTYTQPDGPGTDKSNWDVTNESSRLGVKGSEDLGGGLKAIYQYEFGVNIDGNGTGGNNPWNQRLSSVGLTGGFGTVVLGRVWSAPYLYVGSLTDVFNHSTSFTSMGWDRLNFYSSGNGLAGSGDRIGNVVAYITPSFSGFSGAAAIVMDGAPGSASALGAREDVDAYDIAGGGTFGGLTVGASYRDVQDVFEQWGVGASFKFGFGLTVAATYSSRDYDTSGVGDPSVWDVIGTYAFGNNVILAGYAQYDFDDNRDNLDAWKLGYQYNLSKRTRVFAEYAAENGFGFTEATQTDRNVFSVGMRHDF